MEKISTRVWVRAQGKAECCIGPSLSAIFFILHKYGGALTGLKQIVHFGYF